MSYDFKQGAVIRQGSRESAGYFSITEATKAWPFNVLDLNSLKCHSLGFRDFRTGRWPGFKIKAWKMYFNF